MNLPGLRLGLIVAGACACCSLLAAEREHVFFADQVAPGTRVLRDGRGLVLQPTTYRALSNSVVITPDAAPVRTSLVVPDATLVTMLGAATDFEFVALSIGLPPEKIASVDSRLRRGTAQFDTLNRAADLLVTTDQAEIRARAPFSFEVRVLPPPLALTRVVVLEGKVSARNLGAKTELQLVGPKEVWESVGTKSDKDSDLLVALNADVPPIADAAGADGAALDNLIAGRTAATTARHNEATASFNPNVAPVSATADFTTSVSPIAPTPQ